MKGRERIAALTAYDFPLTKLLDEAGVPFIHVGDTLGMVVLGYPDTTHVTMDDMVHHVRAVARARPRALIAADLPFRSYDTTEAAVANARRLVEAGAEAIKLKAAARSFPRCAPLSEQAFRIAGTWACSLSTSWRKAAIASKAKPRHNARRSWTTRGLWRKRRFLHSPGDCDAHSGKGSIRGHFNPYHRHRFGRCLRRSDPRHP